jgi:chromosomal replication initiator protein
MKNELKAYLLTIHDPEEVIKWFDPLSISPGADGAVEIEFPHQYFANWFLDHYSKTLTQCLHTLFGTHVQVNYRCAGTNRPVPAQRKPARYKKRSASRQPFGKEFTFDSFILNKKNYFPWISSKEIASSEIRYNPFVLCGEPSTGKTHLLRAIANQISESFPEKQLYFGAAEHLNGSYGSGDVLKVRERMLQYDVFVLDDIQHLGKMTGLQEELILLFDSFLARKRQMIFALQGKVSGLEALSEPLASRFNLGLVASLEPPDFNVRSKFVQQQCRSKEIALSKEQVFTLAQKFHDLRQLQGMLLRLHAFKTLVSDHIDDHLFRQVVAQFTGAGEGALTWEVIVETVAGHYGVSTKDILSARRTGAIAKARQVAIFLCRDLLGFSYPKLGTLFGGRDHSTAIYAVKKITAFQQDDQVWNKEIEELRCSCHMAVTGGGAAA